MRAPRIRSVTYHSTLSPVVQLREDYKAFNRAQRLLNLPTVTGLSSNAGSRTIRLKYSDERKRK